MRSCGPPPALPATHSPALYPTNVPSVFTGCGYHADLSPRTFGVQEAQKAFREGDAEYSKEVHQSLAAEEHDSFGEYVKVMVFGGLDGIITTFAVVASIAGADLKIEVSPLTLRRPRLPLLYPPFMWRSCPLPSITEEMRDPRWCLVTMLRQTKHSQEVGALRWFSCSGSPTSSRTVCRWRLASTSRVTQSRST